MQSHAINAIHACMQSILSKYSGLVRKMVNQEKKRRKSKNKIAAELEIKINGFPGGSMGFELATRFCYNNGGYPLTPANLPLLHSTSIFLAMDEDVARCNLHHQAETFLDGLFYWTWSDLLSSLRACEPLFPIADSSGLLRKLLSSLLVKMAAVSSSFSSSSSSGSSSSSSPDCSSGGSASKTMSPARKAWWFDDLTGLSPRMVEKMFKIMDVYGKENNNLVLTRFLLHYLKVAALRSGGTGHGSIARSECGGLAVTAVHGVVSMGRRGFSCRGLFWVLRVVSGFGVGRGVRGVLEGLIGGVLDQACLDDLLVLGHGAGGGGVYDVGLVVRLLRVFAVSGAEEEKGVCLLRMKKVGRLMDRYMGEISPDPGLKVSKLLGVVEGLPDAARDCFDGVYNAIDIYLEV